MLRMLRLARTARAFRLFPSLRVILTGIRHSLPGLGSFLVITVLVLYVYAMLGWMLFGQAYPERYGTVGQAMLTLGLLLSLDGITDTLQAGREVTEWAIAYYLSYMICACYLLTNLLVGVVLNALQEAHEHERRALAARNGPPVDPAAPGSAQAPAGPAVRAVPRRRRPWRTARAGRVGRACQSASSSRCCARSSPTWNAAYRSSRSGCCKRRRTG